MSDSENSPEGCQGKFANAIARSNENQLKLYFDRLIEVQSASFEHAVKANYINVTIIYAGSFLLLQAVSEDVPRQDWSIIVILFFISLTTFAFWTVFTSMRMSRQTIASSKILSDNGKSVERRLAEMEVLDRKMQKESLRYFAVWGWVFNITLLTCFGGAFYLLILYIVNILGLEFSLFGFLKNAILSARE